MPSDQETDQPTHTGPAWYMCVTKSLRTHSKSVIRLVWTNVLSQNEPNCTEAHVCDNAQPNYSAFDNYTRVRTEIARH